MMRTTTRRRWALSAGTGFIAGALGAVVPGATQPATDAASSLTIILVRHAEAGQDDPRNPSLAAAGRERARQLAHVLRDVPVTHLIASQYQRTQQTLEPLSQQTGVAVQEHDAKDPAGLVEILRRLPGNSVAVVAGHSNTVPDLLQRLGASPSGLQEDPKHGWLLPHDEYSRMFLMTLRRPPGEATAQFAGCLELRYGSAAAGQ